MINHKEGKSGSILVSDRNAPAGPFAWYGYQPHMDDAPDALDPNPPEPTVLPVGEPPEAQPEPPALPESEPGGAIPAAGPSSAFAARRGCLSTGMGCLTILVGIPMLICPGPGMAAIAAGVGMIAVGLGLRQNKAE